jgi:hypothetical protein
MTDTSKRNISSNSKRERPAYNLHQEMITRDPKGNEMRFKNKAAALTSTRSAGIKSILFKIRTIGMFFTSVTYLYREGGK